MAYYGVFPVALQFLYITPYHATLPFHMISVDLDTVLIVIGYGSHWLSSFSATAISRTFPRVACRLPCRLHLIGTPKLGSSRILPIPFRQVTSASSYHGLHVGGRVRGHASEALPYLILNPELQLHVDRCLRGTPR